MIDVRGASGGSSGGGGGLPIPGGLGGLGGGAGLIVVIVIVAINVLGGGSGGTGFDLPGLRHRRHALRAPTTRSRLPPGEDPQAELKDFSAYVFDDAQDVWEGTFDRSGDAYDTAKLVLYSGAVQHRRLRRRHLGRRAVLLPGRRARLPRPQLLRGHAAPARRLRRLRLGLRDRARDGPSRPADDGNERRGRPAEPLRPRRRQRALGPPGAAGRLLRGRLGGHRLRRGRPRARRPRRGVQRRRGGRRRPPPEAGDRQRRPRQLHPRHLRAAPDTGSSAATSSGDPGDCDTFAAETL